MYPIFSSLIHVRTHVHTCVHGYLHTYVCAHADTHESRRTVCMLIFKGLYLCVYVEKINFHGFVNIYVIPRVSPYSFVRCQSQGFRHRLQFTNVQNMHPVNN